MRMQSATKSKILSHLNTHSMFPYSFRFAMITQSELHGTAHSRTWTPHAFMKKIASRSRQTAHLISKSLRQYCVNIAAAMINVTVLMQFANLLELTGVITDIGSSYQYMMPTVKPRASSTKVLGKSISGPFTGRTDTISATQRKTENTTRPAMT